MGVIVIFTHINIKNSQEKTFFNMRKHRKNISDFHYNYGDWNKQLKTCCIFQKSVEKAILFSWPSIDNTECVGVGGRAGSVILILVAATSWAAIIFQFMSFSSPLVWSGLTQFDLFCACLGWPCLGWLRSTQTGIKENARNRWILGSFLWVSTVSRV